MNKAIIAELKAAGYPVVIFTDGRYEIPYGVQEGRRARKTEAAKK
jgi:hypothetical protein